MQRPPRTIRRADGGWGRDSRHGSTCAPAVAAPRACGNTRTASLLWCNSHNNGYHFSWLADKDPAFGGGSVDPEETGDGPSAFVQHHEIAHNEDRSDAHKRRKKLVDRERPEPPGVVSPRLQPR
jgi:hypothetical protein